jgi:hypothetical protein
MAPPAAGAAVNMLATCTSSLEQLACEEVIWRLGCGRSDVQPSLGHIRFRLPLALLPRAVELRCVERLWVVAVESIELLSGDASPAGVQADLAALEAFGAAQGEWSVALQAWRCLQPPAPKSGEGEGPAPDAAPLRFRAKCKRAESATGHTCKEHGFTSIDAARCFGGALMDRWGWQVGLSRWASVSRVYPFNIGYLPLHHSGNLGVKWRILQGCQRETLGVGARLTLTSGWPSRAEPAARCCP